MSNRGDRVPRMTILSFEGLGVAGALRNRHDQGRKWVTACEFRHAADPRGLKQHAFEPAGRSRTMRCAGTRWYPVSLPARAATLVVAFLAVVAGVVFVAFEFIGAQPSVENYAPYASGGQVNVTMMTAAQTTVTNKPDWVTYFIKNPSTGNFDHTTYFAVPPDTRVNMTIDGYDGCTPLRNPVWGKVAGTARRCRGRLVLQRQDVHAVDPADDLRQLGELLGAAHLRDPRPRPQRADRVGRRRTTRTATSAAPRRARRPTRTRTPRTR